MRTPTNSATQHRYICRAVQAFSLTKSSLNYIRIRPPHDLLQNAVPDQVRLWALSWQQHLRTLRFQSIIYIRRACTTDPYPGRTIIIPSAIPSPRKLFKHVAAIALLNIGIRARLADKVRFRRRNPRTGIPSSCTRRVSVPTSLRVRHEVTGESM